MCSFKLSRKFTNISKRTILNCMCKSNNESQKAAGEVDGAMWVEADCNLPSGESPLFARFSTEKVYSRGIRAGKHLSLAAGCFWYSWALPQILKKSGINTFMTTKISWNQYNRMPNDTFLWKGIDGSEILTHFITTPVPGGGSWTEKIQLVLHV